jgi:hypothetical protein
MFGRSTGECDIRWIQVKDDPGAAYPRDYFEFKTVTEQDLSVVIRITAPRTPAQPGVPGECTEPVGEWQTPGCISPLSPPRAAPRRPAGKTAKSPSGLTLRTIVRLQ